MEIVLVRHTTPKVEQGILYGQTDLDVVPSFPEEVKAIQNKMPNCEGFRVFSSPLRRCKLLAEALVSDHDRIEFDDRLKELYYGEWENTAWTDLPKEPSARWLADFVNTSAPGGESFIKFYERVSAFWDQLQEEPEDTLIISHSGVLHAIVAHVLEIPLENVFGLKMGYGQIVKIDHNEILQRYQVELINPE